ncbi:MAG TPA: hypothetical protein PLC42_03175 [Parachlamydiaceae bacterium]|nr:hypothetical protein [Parachlamydiaceae bacterium]
MDHANPIEVSMPPFTISILPCSEEENHSASEKIVAFSSQVFKEAAFWETFKAMQESPLKEQVQDIFFLYDLKKKKIKSSFHKILPFSFSLIKSGPSEMMRYSGDFALKGDKREKRGPSVGLEFKTLSLKNSSFLTISDVRATLGKLIYLMGKDISKINNLLINKEQKEQIKLIDHLFEEELDKIEKDLNQFKQRHKICKIQDHNRALAARIPIELAKALISDSGTLNIGIIEPLMGKFLTTKRELPFEKNIAFILNYLKTSVLLRQKLHLIAAPFSLTSPASDLVRITLGLKANELVTALHAKKTALAALLSHMRQSPASSCFASYLAIEILSKDPIKCLSDFSELLLSNHLSREINGEKKEFSFLMRTGKESVSKKIQIDQDGKIYSENQEICHILEVPGIQAAVKSMGIKGKKRKLQEILFQFAKNQKSPIFSISCSKLLKAFAKRVPGDFTYNFNYAKLSFESELHNPLLRIFENTIASMAEGREHSKIKEMLIIAFTETILPLCGNDATFKQMLAKKIRYNLKESTYFAYDTDIKAKLIASDGKSERGAFILYQKSASPNIKDWQQIKTHEDFAAFALTIIRKSFIGISEKEQTVNEIKKFIQTDAFIIRCLQLYQKDNLKIMEELGKEERCIENIKVFSHTPWCDKTGNNSSEVIKIYFNNDLLAPSVILNTKDTTKLLSILIDFAKKFPDQLNSELIKNPGLLSPLIIKDVHACSCMFGHPTFLRAVRSKIPSLQWLDENLIQVGKAVSDTKLSADERKKLLLLVSHHAINRQDPQVLQKFTEKTALIESDCTLFFFRNSLVQIIKEIHNSSYLPFKTIVNGIDFFIYKHILKEEIQKKLVGSAIHFADTNWHAGLHDIHFCFIFNPGSKNIEMWEVYENNEGLYPLCQEDWVKKQTWQVYNP